LRRIRFLVEERGLNVAGLEMTLSMADRLDLVGAASSGNDLRAAISEALDFTDDQAEPKTKRDSALKGGSSR
jgi:hypothetical protein